MRYPSHVKLLPHTNQWGSDIAEEKRGVEKYIVLIFGFGC